MSDLKKQNIIDETMYDGYYRWYPTDLEWAAISVMGNQINLDTFCVDFPESELSALKENEFVIVYDNDNRPVSYYYREGNRLIKAGRGIISFSGKGKDKTQIKARNPEQSCAISMLQNDNISVCAIGGRWGSGKTLLLVTAALEALEHNKFDRIVWIRNNVDVADTKDLGALPGDVNDKLLPFLGPFVDHAGQAKVECMLNNGHLVIEPLQSLRGRNFENTLIMCSESENLTKEHLQLIIARAAEGSQVWFDFDIKQRDKRKFEESRGVEKMISRFAGNKLFGYVRLVECERSETAALADLLDD